MQLLIVSTSTIFGQPYLQYMETEVCSFFKKGGNVLFVPYARPGGISHNEYTSKAAEVFGSWGFSMQGAHAFATPAEALAWADGVFTGGGNTFLLLKTLYEAGLFPLMRQRVREGLPYMGTSAGANITGLSIGTTNDMPIVQPPSFEAMGWVPFNINPHYLDPVEGSTHMGETRETRIEEFHHFNAQPVIGLREGSWIHVNDHRMELKGSLTARCFMPQQPALELSPGLLQWSV